MLGASLSEVWGDDFTIKKKKKNKKQKTKPLTPEEMDRDLLINDEDKDIFNIDENQKIKNLSKSIKPDDPFYSFNKNVVTRNQPYGQRPRIIEEDPDYEDFMRFKAMKYNTDKEFRKDNLKVNNQSNNQLNELLLYIFTGFFLLIIYDNMYHFGKKSY
tara:strand:- start:276 stop:749 length:474 start_codon:yes stop_codon:yes gene_type:complete